MGLTLTPPEAGRSRTAPTGAGRGAMSDDLVKLLRCNSVNWLTNLAADRIEELEAELAKARDTIAELKGEK